MYYTPVHLVESVENCGLYMRRYLACSSCANVMHQELTITRVLRYDASARDYIMRNRSLPSLPLSCTGFNFYWLDEVNRSIVQNIVNNNRHQNMQVFLSLGFFITRPPVRSLDLKPYLYSLYHHNDLLSSQGAVYIASELLYRYNALLNKYISFKYLVYVTIHHTPPVRSTSILNKILLNLAKIKKSNRFLSQ